MVGDARLPRRLPVDGAFLARLTAPVSMEVHLPNYVETHHSHVHDLTRERDALQASVRRGQASEGDRRRLALSPFRTPNRAPRSRSVRVCARKVEMASVGSRTVAQDRQAIAESPSRTGREDRRRQGQGEPQLWRCAPPDHRGHG